MLYMNAYRRPSTATVSDTRRDLTGHVARFRAEGIDAAPVVFGERRHPDAVLLPYETFELLLDLAEDLVLAERIRERESQDSGRRTPLADVAAAFGVDLNEL